jgi:hypothetical protein
MKDGCVGWEPLPIEKRHDTTVTVMVKEFGCFRVVHPAHVKQFVKITCFVSAAQGLCPGAKLQGRAYLHR